jgi:hypothetical protein
VERKGVEVPNTMEVVSAMYSSVPIVSSLSTSITFRPPASEEAEEEEEEKKRCGWRATTCESGGTP